MDCDMPGFPVHHHLLSLLKLTSIKSVIPSNHLILCCPLLLLPSIFPRVRVFSSELAIRIRWLKYWSLSFSINPSSEYSRLISFRIKWFHLLAIQGTLKSTETLCWMVIPSNHLILSCPLLLPPQHQGLFQWVSSSLQVAKVLEFQLQHQPFQWIFRTCLL